MGKAMQMLQLQQSACIVVINDGFGMWEMNCKGNLQVQQQGYNLSDFNIDVLSGEGVMVM